MINKNENDKYALIQFHKFFNDPESRKNKIFSFITFAQCVGFNYLPNFLERFVFPFYFLEEMEREVRLSYSIKI